MKAIRNFFDEYGLHYSQVTSNNIIDFLAVKQYRDHISISYKNTLYHYLRVFFSWAYRKNYIDEDVMRGVDPIKQPVKTKIRLTDEEVERCRVVARNNIRDKALLELMLSTGMRVGEIANLDIPDLDFVNERIHIWGEKTNQARIGYMTPACKIALSRYIGNRTTGKVFLSSRKSCCGVSRETLEAIAKRIAKEANINTHATVHIYRKTFASITYRRTNDILLVSKLLGHSDTTTTMKYYLVDDIEDMMYKMKKIS